MFILYNYKYKQPYNKQYVCKKVLRVHRDILSSICSYDVLLLLLFICYLQLGSHPVATVCYTYYM